MGQNEKPIMAEMGLGFKQYHKVEREMGQLWAKNESQLWAEIGLGIKQYHKSRRHWANKGPKISLGQQRTNNRPNND